MNRERTKGRAVKEETRQKIEDSIKETVIWLRNPPLYRMETNFKGLESLLQKGVINEVSYADMYLKISKRIRTEKRRLAKGGDPNPPEQFEKSLRRMTKFWKSFHVLMEETDETIAEFDRRHGKRVPLKQIAVGG